MYPAKEEVRNWRMWESWELIQGKPNLDDRNENGYTELSFVEMTQLFKDVPLQSDYSIGIEPFVLPVSLAQFHKIFIDDDAPYFMD